jgi:uncharacterized protein YdeI (YjbR/CyaY-like superfamily)
MEITGTLYVTNRDDWRSWLEKNHASLKEIWLIFPKKATGKERIPYNDAVEEALSFGWIDSTVKKIDDNQYAQRFSPRKQGSPYSEANKARLKWLDKEGKLTPEVRKSVERILKEKFVNPPDIIKAIRSNKAAWTNFQNFSPEYIRIRIAFIDGARDRPLEFKKRLDYFIKMTESNKQFGFGGIEKHF